MKKGVLYWGGLVAVIGLFGVCASAGASPITLGNPTLVTGKYAYGCEKPFGCTFVSISPPNAGGIVVRSPVDGAIVRWSISASPTTGYAIRTLRRDGNSFTGGKASGPVTVTAFGVQEFTSNVPIHAGDLIGLDVPPEGIIRSNELAGSLHGYMVPTLAEGQSHTTGEFPGELALNAQIQPAPKVTGIAPIVGPTAGGTTVRVTGSEFTGVSGVRFGGVPAPSFSVESDGALTAVTPPVPPSHQVVPVTVITNAGESPLSAYFEYLPPESQPEQRRCVVPDLRGRRLAVARRKAKRALCAIGAVRRPRHKTGGLVFVVRQSPGPGAVGREGTMINVAVRHAGRRLRLRSWLVPHRHGP
ncbi:MAG TPA: IPT/TIG domain-containing protein [Solirubrobacterales bacterium]